MPYTRPRVQASHLSGKGLSAGPGLASHLEKGKQLALRKHLLHAGQAPGATHTASHLILTLPERQPLLSPFHRWES